MVRPSTSTPTDRLIVVHSSLVAKGEVVHGALGSGEHFEGTVDRVCDRLTHLHVPCDHCTWIERVYHRPFWKYHLERLEAPSVKGYIVAYEGPEDIYNCRLSNAGRCIEVGKLLRCSPRKVKRRLSFIVIDGDGDFDVGLSILVTVHQIREASPGAGQVVDDPPDGLLRVVLHVPHVGGDDLEAVVGHHPVQLFDAGLVGGDLSPEVRQVLVHVAGGVGVVKKQSAGLLLQKLASVDELHVIDEDALLMDVSGERGHGSRGYPPNLAVMTP
mmetsp:Transcript_63161/g.86849  ORF Transcript_63161/g.86849 Transcript_63161/m.86849 type:complete len:271 (+) Transcript_63161:641-1453(+)